MNRFATMQIFAGEVTGAAILVLFGVGVGTARPLPGRLINPALAAISAGICNLAF